MYEGEDPSQSASDDEDIIAEHMGGRDWKKITYAVIFLALLVFVSVLPNLHRLIVLDDSGNIAGFSIPLGLVFAATILFLLGRRYRLNLPGTLEWGSYIDVPGKRIVWWDGPPPRVERTIDIAQLSRITFDEDAMTVWNRNGEEVGLPQHCVGDVRKWAWAITKRFPEIDYDWTDQYPTLQRTRTK